MEREFLMALESSLKALIEKGIKSVIATIVFCTAIVILFGAFK